MCVFYRSNRIFYKKSQKIIKKVFTINNNYYIITNVVRNQLIN